MMRSASIRMMWWSALAGLALVALVGVAWNFTQESLKASAFVSHTHAVMSVIGEAEAQLFRAEAAQRAFLVGLDPKLVAQREAAVAALDQSVGEIGRLTVDNAVQQRRVEGLKKLLDQRVETFRQTQAALQGGAPMSPSQRLEEGAGFRDLVHPVFAAMLDDERTLLSQRQAVDVERARTVETTFAALAIGLLLLLPLAIWRLRADAQARHVAETEAAKERHFDALHARALTLYNAESDQAATLDGTLALLAEGGLFPASAVYLHDELSGSLRLAASRGAPADVQPLVRVGDGPLGEAAHQRQPVYLENGSSGATAAGGWVIETGLAQLRPAALLCCPVSHQGRLLGVLVLAAMAHLSARERNFVDRLCAQLGVALHNLDQLAGLNSLAQALRERSADIERKNEELLLATRMKTEFLANMSHELRTPLNAVIGFSEILRDGMVGPLSTEQTEFIGHVHNSGKHLLSLINDILDLSKVEAGQMELHLAAESLQDIVASTVPIVRQRAAERSLRLTDDCDSGLGLVQVDGRKVRQIIGNLLSNSVKFTPEGGTVTLKVRKAAAAEVAAATRPVGEAGTRVFPPPRPAGGDAPAAWVAIEVTDTGIGIEPEGLAQLFQPFVQIDSSLTREYEGTGLGLTMVQRLAALHGGGMKVQSRVGQGSTFTVWLPWRTGQEPGAAAHPAPLASVPAINDVALTAGAGADTRPGVLVIDDDATSANLLRAQLQAHGYRVDVALEPLQGLALAKSLQPEAIILDVLMPGLDGWEMLARLKEHERTRHIPVVIVSITDEPRRGFALGAAQVLLKPVAKEELLAALAASRLQPRTADARVLVVDDDPDAVTIVSSHLQAAGYNPVCAYGGQEALDSVARSRPALIVLDLMMPHVSGFDVVEALGSRPDTADIPIIVLTAKLVTARDRELLRGRVQRLMEKAGFDTSALLAEVRRAMAPLSPPAAPGYSGRGARPVVP
jgi:signal transduction histidine kinase/CheY-like chemotaxis protein/CHASE3 domain sensor protein